MRHHILFVFITIFIVSSPTYAANPGELEQQIEQVRREREVLQEEQRKLQSELESINKEALTLGTAVKSLDTAKKKLSSDIKVTQSKITTTTLTIKSLENTMTDKEKQIVVHRKAIAQALSALSQHDHRPLLVDVLASASLSQVWGDRSNLAGLSTRLGDEIDGLRETRKQLDAEKAQKEKVKQQQLSLQSQLSGQKSIVEENQQAKEKLLAQTKSVEAEYQKMLAENLARQKQFEADLYRLESELNITLDPSLIPLPKQGLIAWPLDNVFVTQKFGKTAASGRLYTSGTHNGVDFRASQGTPVKAVSAGIVEGTGNTDEQKGCGSYGRWVLIKHPNGLTSVYAHLSAGLVQKGQSIKTGEVIGYSGGMPGVFGSGYSTGPHLHLGLFASQGVSIQQFVSSKGCKQTIVPIVDVKAYLDPLSYLPAI